MRMARVKCLRDNVSTAAGASTTHTMYSSPTCVRVMDE
jgi:hypothetical protein